MTRVHLLDANVLIALTVAEHEHHRRVATWVSDMGRFALCPVVEGSLIRFLVRLGQSQTLAKALLEGLYASSRCEFWPDDLSYREAGLGHVRGHRQVTDAYLASLAASRDGVLATLDERLAKAVPEHVVLIG